MWRSIKTVGIAIFLLCLLIITLRTSFAYRPQAPATPSLLISEIRIDQSGPDNDEYFELMGTPGASLDGYTYLVIGDGSGGSGVIEAAVPLTGYVIPANGYFLAVHSTFSLTGTATLTTGFSFENSDNVTHLLVKNFSGANGDDLDTNDDGTLEVTPWETIVDLIALVEEANPPTKTEYHYGPPAIGPDGTFVPGHVIRCYGAWQIGAFATNSDDTPGAANTCTAPPQILISEIRIDQSGSDNDEFFELTGPAGAFLDGYTYLVIGDGSGGSGVIESVTPLTDSVMPASGYFVAAKESFTLITRTLTATFNFENSDNVTHLLVKGFTGSNGDDLDTNDDGTLDMTPWSSIADCVALIETVGSGDRTYCSTAVGPDGSFVPGHAYRCGDSWRIGAFTLGADDTPGGVNACPAAPAPIGLCGEATTAIHDVQGSGSASPLVGGVHVVEGVVVGDFQDPTNSLGGFFLQEEPDQQDGDAQTSEGIFVFDNGAAIDVQTGDVVRVQGSVEEFFNLTRIHSVITATVCSSGYATTPLTLTLPVSSTAEWENYEGMLVTLPQTLTVSDNYNLGRYGEIDVSAGGRLYNPTNVVTPGAAATALQAENDRRRIQLDDGSNLQNPMPLPPYFAPDGTLRAGDVTSNVVGVLSYAFGKYEIHPTAPVTFTRANPRQPKPAPLSGSLTVASMNVLNYFTTIDTGAAICGPGQDLNCRGADTPDEFTRQRSKILAALAAMDADIVGLVEIENNPNAALEDIVSGLNAITTTAVYSYVNTGTIGSDAIKVGILYRTASVSPVGSFAILDSKVDSRFIDTRNRPSLAQSFRQHATGGVFTLVVNHLKSKGSSCSDLGDPDTGDGQGNCNQTRTSAAQALVDWLATDPTGIGDPDYLLIGDFNAYAQEDPITALKAGADDQAGNDDDYSNLIEKFVGADGYSFVFNGQAGYLDHALASSTLVTQVVGTVEWHINGDEPRALDYNDFNQAVLFQPTPYRSSDHDPVVVSLDLPTVGQRLYLPLTAK